APRPVDVHPVADLPRARADPPVQASGPDHGAVHEEPPEAIAAPRLLGAQVPDPPAPPLDPRRRPRRPRHPRAQVLQGRGERGLHRLRVALGVGAYDELVHDPTYPDTVVSRLRYPFAHARFPGRRP